MTNRWLLAILALLCLVTSTACGAASPAPLGPKEPSPISAVNGFTALALPAAPRDRELAAMQAEGVQEVRADAPWAWIEPDPPGPHGHVWHLARIDAWVGALAMHHLRWEPIIDYAVGWAKRCRGFCAPDGTAPYAAFAREIAARYGAGGSFWTQHPNLPSYPVETYEIWNEENTSAFRIAAAQYATLYAAARGAIHDADPGASVIVGGLADDSKDFNPNADYPAWYVQQMFDADPRLRGNVDGFGLHPYGSSSNAVLQWVVHFRSVLDGLGEASAPIDITEFGWDTGDSSREDWRASQMNLVALTLSRSNCGIGMLTPYDWVDPASMPEPADFGLVTRTGKSPSLRPAAKSWFGGLHRAAAMSQLRLCPQTSATAETARSSSKGQGSGASRRDHGS